MGCKPHTLDATMNATQVTRGCEAHPLQAPKCAEHVRGGGVSSPPALKLPRLDAGTCPGPTSAEPSPEPGNTPLLSLAAVLGLRSPARRVQRAAGGGGTWGTPVQPHPTRSGGGALVPANPCHLGDPKKGEVKVAA